MSLGRGPRTAVLAIVLVAGCGTSAMAIAQTAPAPAPAPAVIENKPEPAPVAAEPPPPAVTVPQTPVAPVNEEEQQAIALLADLQRFTSESPEDLRRELVAANQAVNRARTDANRIRLAVLITLPAAGPTDDARALALLESVFGKVASTSPVKQLAAVLYLQIAERMRGVAEEKKKSAAAQEKLDQLRAVERSLLMERSRNAGGAGGGGGGGTGR